MKSCGVRLAAALTGLVVILWTAACASPPEEIDRQASHREPSGGISNSEFAEVRVIPRAAGDPDLQDNRRSVTRERISENIRSGSKSGSNRAVVSELGAAKGASPSTTSFHERRSGSLFQASTSALRVPSAEVLIVNADSPSL